MLDEARAPDAIVKGKKFAMTPRRDSGEHHSLCPVCGASVDKPDLEDVLQHVDLEHGGATEVLAREGLAARIGWMESVHELPAFERYPPREWSG